jgi:hypothetical protein
MDSPSKHGGGLRAEIAATVSATTSIRKGGVQVLIVSRGPKMPEGKGNLPVDFNDDKKFYHPVYARGERFTLRRSRAAKYRGKPESEVPLVKQGAWTWVHQDSRAEGWFDRTIAARYPELRRACEAALDRTRKALEG